MSFFSCLGEAHGYSHSATSQYFPLMPPVTFSFTVVHEIYNNEKKITLGAWQFELTFQQKYNSPKCLPVLLSRWYSTGLLAASQNKNLTSKDVQKKRPSNPVDHYRWLKTEKGWEGRRAGGSGGPSTGTKCDWVHYVNSRIINKNSILGETSLQQPKDRLYMSPQDWPLEWYHRVSGAFGRGKFMEGS